ncbi:hypothetical protein FDF26_17445 [Clostridium botulinum]|nr:hypothetical protein [Clostridium botulinum]
MKIKNNAIYYYDKVRNHWNTHGVVFTVKKNGVLWAVDTYHRQDIEQCKNLDYFNEFDKVWKVKDIKNDLEYIMDIDDILEVDERTFQLYDYENRVHIPIGNWHERYLVNKNKSTNKENEGYKLKSEIESLKYQIKYNQKEIIEKENRLKELEIME